MPRNFSCSMTVYGEVNDATPTSFHHRNDEPGGTQANRVHIGCSGWIYRHWKGGFYPADLPQRRWFEHYATALDTVEINASFYRVPLPSTFDGWQAKAPPGFRYALKVNRFITHDRKLVNVEQPLTEFVALARRMGPALGPMLHQLPPSLHRDDTRLSDYLALLPQDLEHVVEFRHASWYDEAVLAQLDRAGVGFVTHDLVGLASPRWSSGRTAYVRFHGTGGKYRGRYNPEQIAAWAAWLAEQQSHGRSAWAYFNNDIGGDALADARSLREAVASSDARKAATRFA